MAAQYWLGLDIGTSSVKALLIGPDGVVRARADASYDSSFGPDGEAEQSPHEYLRGTREVIAACGVMDVDLRGIGLVGQTPTLVLADRDGEPVRPALTWQDTRAAAEAQELAEELGSSEPLFGVELPWTPSYPPARLLWLSRHEPDSVRRTRWALQPKDFVGLHLTGSPLSDPWSTKGLCNVIDIAAATCVLGRTGWTADVVPPLAAAWAPRGVVSAKAASAFGLAEGTPVAVGWSDALAGMLAVGAFDAATGFVLSGTSNIVGLSTEIDNPTGGSLLAIPRTCAPLSVVYGPTQSGGASVEWLSRVLGTGVTEVLALASRAGVADGESPLFVPYLSGERAPVWRTDVRGAFLGLSAHDGAAELARAVVAGVCLSELHVLSTAEAHLGTRAGEVHVAGRGASQSPWRESRLATLERPLCTLAESDASALGAAMLAAAAATGGNLAAARELRGSVERIELPGGENRLGSRDFERYLEGSAVCLAWSPGTR